MPSLSPFSFLTALFGQRNIETKTIISWIFRIGVSAEFIGHGAFGIITKESWIPYFNLFGIDRATGFATMPIVGAIDISFGVLAFVMPLRALLLWMTFWGIFTATIRPLSGESWFELPERTYNFGIAFCFLYLAGFPTKLREWFTPIVPSKLPTLTKPRAHTLGIILRLIIVGFLIGHGGYGAFLHKEVQMYHFASIGLGGNVISPLLLVTIVGWLEFILAVAVLIKPTYTLLVFVLAWKLFTEFLFPMSGAPIFEFIERGGAYAAPLALIFLQAFYPPAAAPIWNQFRRKRPSRQIES
jgi:hypothetical protein